MIYNSIHRFEVWEAIILRAVVIIMFIFFSMQQLHLISDIDECEEKFHNCDPVTQICVNTQGSFECQKQHRCPVGFQLDIVSQTCVGECWISVTKIYI
jgi:hypothetical protein